MKDIDGYLFPENPGEAREWRPVVRRVALSSHVLAVARTRIEGAWAAYIDAVPGLNFDYEMDEVLLTGQKLSEATARHFFPMFPNIPYAS